MGDVQQVVRCLTSWRWNPALRSCRDCPVEEGQLWCKIEVSSTGRETGTHNSRLVEVFIDADHPRQLQNATPT